MQIFLLIVCAVLLFIFSILPLVRRQQTSINSMYKIMGMVPIAVMIQDHSYRHKVLQSFGLI